MQKRHAIDHGVLKTSCESSQPPSGVRGLRGGAVAEEVEQDGGARWGGFVLTAVDAPHSQLLVTVLLVS